MLAGAGRPLAFSLLRMPTSVRLLADTRLQVTGAALALTLLAFLGLMRAPVFVDEADNVLTACLIARGSVPYRDVFSHHFPAPYYALAAFGETAACSVLAGRVLGALLLTAATAAFAWAARSTLASLGMLVMALAAPLYYLHLYLAETFICAGLIMTLALLTHRGRRLRGVPGVALRVVACTILSSSSPLGLMMAALLAPLVVLAAGRPSTPVIGACAAGLLSWPLALAVQGTLPAFVEQAVVFNTQVYGTYLPVHLTDPVALLWATFSFARHRFSFGMDWLIGEEMAASTATFGAAFELVSLLLLGSLVWLRSGDRLFRLALVLLLPLAVARDGFHLSAYLALVAIGCGYLLGGLTRWRLVLSGLALATLLVALRVYFFALPVDLPVRDELVASLESEALVQRYAAPDAPVLYLPIAPQGYLAEARRPGSFYTYFLPWIADMPGAQERLIADIERQQVAVIVLDQDARIWDRYRFREYAPAVYAHILATYRPVDSNDRRKARIFVRNGPELERR